MVAVATQSVICVTRLVVNVVWLVEIAAFKVHRQPMYGVTLGLVGRQLL